MDFVTFEPLYDTKFSYIYCIFRVWCKKMSYQPAARNLICKLWMYCKNYK